MNTFTYESVYDVSLRFIKRYTEIIKPNRIRNTEEHRVALSQLAIVYDTLLQFICQQGFFNTLPDQHNKLHILQLYLAYQDGFIEQYSVQKAPSTIIEDIKTFIECKMKDETWLLADHNYHLYEQILHKDTQTIHIFGLYQKTYSGSYCFFLLDCIYEYGKTSEIKIQQDERYCLQKYNEFMLHLKEQGYSTIEIFCRENNFSYKKIYSRFKRYYGCSFKQFLLQQQLLTALFLIIYSRKSLKEIAHEVGFEDYSNFQKAFKRYGITPSHIKRIYF